MTFISQPAISRFRVARSVRAGVLRFGLGKKASSGAKRFGTSWVKEVINCGTQLGFRLRPLNLFFFVHPQPNSPVKMWRPSDKTRAEIVTRFY